MNSDNQSGRHSGEGRNPVLENTPRSGQNLVVVPLAREISIGWIPAFAGMTVFRSKGLFWLNTLHTTLLALCLAWQHG